MDQISACTDGLSCLCVCVCFFLFFFALPLPLALLMLVLVTAVRHDSEPGRRPLPHGALRWPCRHALPRQLPQRHRDHGRGRHRRGRGPQRRPRCSGRRHLRVRTKRAVQQQQQQQRWDRSIAALFATSIFPRRPVGVSILYVHYYILYYKRESGKLLSWPPVVFDVCTMSCLTRLRQGETCLVGMNAFHVHVSRFAPLLIHPHLPLSCGPRPARRHTN